MKTKEERAELALRIYTSEDIPQYDEYAEGVQAGQAYGFKDGYIVGAEEQKAIDEDHLREVKKMLIEKACKWWNMEMREVDYGTYDGAIEAFRKAMEE